LGDWIVIFIGLKNSVESFRDSYFRTKGERNYRRGGAIQFKIVEWAGVALEIKGDR